MECEPLSALQSPLPKGASRRSTPTHEPRIGSRVELEAVAVSWTPRVSSRWADRIRATRFESDVMQVSTSVANALICNISVSGAGILAPDQRYCEVGTTVEVALEPGSDVLGTIRQVLPSESPGYAYFGVEFVSSSDAFKAWLFDTIAAAEAARNL